MTRTLIKSVLNKIFRCFRGDRVHIFPTTFLNISCVYLSSILERLMRCLSFSSWFYILRISSSIYRCLHSLNNVKTIRLTMRFLVLHEIKVYSSDVLFIWIFQSWNTHRVRQVFQTASNAYIWRHGEVPFQDKFSDVIRELGVSCENSLETIVNWGLFHHGRWFSSTVINNTR